MEEKLEKMISYNKKHTKQVIDEFLYLIWYIIIKNLAVNTNFRFVFRNPKGQFLKKSLYTVNFKSNQLFVSSNMAFVYSRLVFFKKNYFQIRNCYKDNVKPIDNTSQSRQSIVSQIFF